MTPLEALAKATAFADEHVAELALEISDLHDTGLLPDYTKMKELGNMLYELGLSGGSASGAVRMAKYMILDSVLKSYVKIVKGLKVLNKGD